jgi:hypothetical protein
MSDPQFYSSYLLSDTKFDQYLAHQRRHYGWSKAECEQHETNRRYYQEWVAWSKINDDRANRGLTPLTLPVEIQQWLEHGSVRNQLPDDEYIKRVLG